MRTAYLAPLAALLPALLGCGSSDAPTFSTTGTGGGGTTSASTGASGGGGAGGQGGAPDVASEVYPTIQALHSGAVASTCSLNEGVCHSSKQYPELGKAKDLLSTLGEPCQLSVADPAKTLDECEVPGDELVLGGTGYEILHVLVVDASIPTKLVQVRLSGNPASFASAGAVVRRMAGGQEVLSKPLDATSITAIAGYPSWAQIDLSNADIELRRFIDTRVWYGDRVRQGDANDNGMAHASSSPWALVVPGAPERSFLYQRLIRDDYGSRMPLVPRTWNAAATRAVWCWIRGLPADATPGSVSLQDPIDYASCPPDPDAPDPNATGGWPPVKTLVGSRCATSNCHSPSEKAGELDMTPNAATFAAQVLNAPSAQKPGVLRVVPGQPTASYLLCKIDPACTERADNTDLMPVTGDPLTADEIKLFSDWIVNGAPLQ